MKSTQRKHLPDIRPSITVHGVHNGLDYYVSVGFYDTPGDRTKPGEIFVTIAKEGSDTRHFVGCWAQLASIALQYGLPWDKIAGKIENTPGRPMMCSIVDSINEAIKTRADIIGASEDPFEDDVTPRPDRMRKGVKKPKRNQDVEEDEELVPYIVVETLHDDIVIARIATEHGYRFNIKNTKTNNFMSSEGTCWKTPKEHYDSLFLGWATHDAAKRDWMNSAIKAHMDRISQIETPNKKEDTSQ